MQDISSRMDAVCRRFEELSMRLNQPDTAADPALFRKLMRERRPKPCSKNPSPIRTSSR